MTEKLKLCTHREYTASNGKRYLRGFLASTKVLIFKDERAEPPPGCEAVWTVFLEQSEPRPSSRQEPAQSPRASIGPRYHPPAVTQGGRKVSAKPKRNRPAEPAGGAPFNDSLADLLPTTAERGAT